MKKGGCWIFLSHSSKDIAKVRLVRNEFEKHSHNPLAFHLKCLNDQTPEGKAELDDLIIREIDAREWFIYCESPAASDSDYVELERCHILKSGKQNVWSLDMTSPMEDILHQVREICTFLRVFISFAQRDGSHIYNALLQALVEKDFDVWDSVSDMDASNPFAEQMSDVIDHTAGNGFAVILITNSYSKSDYCLLEMERLLQSGAILFPFVVENAPIPLPHLTKRCYQMSRNPSPEEIDMIAELIEKELQTRIQGPIKNRAYARRKIQEIQKKFHYPD